VLAPVPDRRIGSVKASFRSPYGEIRSAWKYEKDGAWEWTFTVPPNTTATMIAPGGTSKEYASGTHTLHRAEIGLNVP
jgi:alpha-L-rhamnosidase